MPHNNHTLAVHASLLSHLPSSCSFDGNASIDSALEMAGFSTADLLSLGELGIVGVLSFEAVMGEDTATYTCVASNALSQTTTLEATSIVSLTVLGKL